MRYALLLLLVLGCVPGQLALAERPPQAPPVIDFRFVSTAAPARSDECDCQDKNEADGCACPKCECKLCVGHAVDLNESNGTYETSTSAVPIKTVAMTPPTPKVTPAPPLSFQEGNASAAAEVGVSTDDMARLNEAHRRLAAAGYEWKEVEECELCDTCPSGFRYTGRTFFTAVKDYDEGQMVGKPDPTSSTAPLPSGSAYSSYSQSPPTVYRYESSCGSDYSYSAPLVSYSTPYYGEASCGSEGYSTGYYSSPAAYSRPRIFRGGFFRRIFSRRAAPVSSFSSPYYSQPVRSYGGFGGCLTGNCG